MPAPESLPSVIGDFVLAWGHEAAAWVRGLPGFTVVADEPAVAAVRGGAQHGTSENGKRWLALADLIKGRLENGMHALVQGAAPPQRHWRGRFAQVAWDPRERRAAALTDHFATLSLYTLAQGDGFAVATDLRLLARSPWCRRTIDLESVYHYLNFACIPAPRTIFREIRRLEPGTRLLWPGPSDDRWFLPEYPEDLRGSESKLARELTERIVASVETYGPRAASGWGCFLSGGTDSSSIVSILSRQSKPTRVRAFSIGFAEQDYDELGYAQIAADACGAEATFHKVSREEATALVSAIVEGFDQPFGNASAIPTLACAKLARDRGVAVMLAGDGGDEVFGGNERYAKDKVMEAWHAMPAPLKAVGRAIGGAAGGSSVHFLNRVENFFERASLPNPDRFYTDDSFASDHFEALLSADFRRAVARDASLDFMRGVYRLGRSGGPLHRIMRLDLLMAIAQNDLVKVHGAARQVGVSVRFPLLDPPLVEHANRLPERHKVRGLSKRHLFKRAMRGILPEETLRKKKHGFGVPIAVWMRSDRAFEETVKDALFDGRAAARGWWEPAFVERLMGEHKRGSWDHSDYIWRLFVLELWLRRHVDGG
jgi:asparagine synthase (glutamine-hydrolysing)